MENKKLYIPVNSKELRVLYNTICAEHTLVGANYVYTMYTYSIIENKIKPLYNKYQNGEIVIVEFHEYELMMIRQALKRRMFRVTDAYEIDTIKYLINKIKSIINEAYTKALTVKE